MLATAIFDRLFIKSNISAMDRLVVVIYFTQTLQIDGFSCYKEKQWLSFSIHKVIWTCLGSRFSGHGVFLLSTALITCRFRLWLLSVVYTTHSAVIKKQQRWFVLRWILTVTASSFQFVASRRCWYQRANRCMQALQRRHWPLTTVTELTSCMTLSKISECACVSCVNS